MGRQDSRGAVAAAARRLFNEGLLTGTSGNVSVRDGDRVRITPTGVVWSEVRAEHVATVDLDGERMHGSAPSSETPLHCRLYGLRPDTGAIVHTHSHYATVFSVLRRPIEAVHYLIAFGGRRIEVADYACYGTAALAAKVADRLGAGRCVLLANHGLVALGPDLASACTTAMAVEEVARLQFHASLLGTPVVLDDAQLAEVEARLSTYGVG